jgi:putative transcriptional regulator
MSLRKLSLVAMLATVVALAAAGNPDRHIDEFDVARPNAKPRGPSVAAQEMPRALFLPVQSKDATDLSAGRLLVASRGLADPNFSKTVILLVRFDDEGVVGLILNRRTDIPLSRVLEGLEGAKDRTDPAYLGGPVEVPSVFALFKSPAKVEGAERVFGGVYLISTKTLFQQTVAARPDPQVFHVYLGYAGWTKDQLRKEVELGAWFIFPADAAAVFNSDPSSLWPQMIRKTELKLADDFPDVRATH